MKKRTEIDPIRAERINIIIKNEGLSQRKFADRLGMSPENLNRIVNRRNPLTEDTARMITDLFPGYRLEWLLGYDDHMTAEDLRRSFIDRSQSNNDASIQILDTALREVCSREGIPVPLLDDIPELWFLQAQLRDFADSLMWNYVIHRDHSHVWSYLDQISVKSDVKATSAKTAPESD